MVRSLSRRSWMVLVLAVAVLPALVTVPREAVAASDAWETLWEHWYTLEIGGTTAGWSKETVSSDGARYRTAVITNMKISRGPIEIKISMESEFIETHDGKPVTLHFEQNMAQQTVDTQWVFHDDHVMETAEQGGRTLEKRLELPDEAWLTPMAAHQYRLESHKGGAKRISYRMINGESGMTPIAITQEFVGEDEVEFEGRMLPVTVWNNTATPPGLSSKSTMSSDGYLLSEEVNLPFGQLVTQIVTEEVAVVAGAEPGPELMVKTFVNVDVPIKRPRQTKTSVLRLRALEGDMPELPSAGAQRVEAGENASEVLLRVDIESPLSAELSDKELAKLVGKSSMVDTSDPLISKLSKRACRKAGTETFARAEAMRKFVHGHVTSKSLDTAFATASETARTRRGDCSEHGVLLCAMLRADGIPARVATGLIYVDSFAGARNIFGWHMWTQGLIDGRWVDFDSTLEARYDAVHVLTGTSDLDAGASSDMAAVLKLMGNLEIDVVDVAY